LEGITFDFDDLYKQCIPLSLPGAQISVESRESHGMGDDPLNVKPADSEALIGRLNIPGNLPKGVYTLFYKVRTEPGQGEMQWGKVKVIKANHPNDVNEERMLYSSFGSEWQPGINLESTRMNVTGGDILEFYAQPGFDKNMELVHLWLSALPDD
jgi:hypothetical protein